MKTEWKKIALGEILDYEQPTKYIVESTDYKEEYEIPVLTAGKSFLLGYTNETEGIYDNPPVIIFDDFTTSSQYVDFKFKVKSSAMKLLTPKNDLINLKFVFLAMQRLKFDITRHKRYYLSAYQNLKIPMPFKDGKPDIEKQNQIVSIIEKAEDLKNKREKARELSDEYLKTVFNDLFLKDKENFERGILSDYILDFIVPQRDKPKEFGGEIPWCRIEDFDGIYLSKSKSGQNVTKETIKKMNLKVYPINSVIVSCSADLGKCAIIKKPLVTNQTFIGLVPSEKINSLFLYYYMKNKSGLLNSMATGATIKYLSKKNFQNLSVNIPPIELQEKFASIVKEIEKLKEQQKDSKKNLDELFDSLVKKAFAGELI